MSGPVPADAAQPPLSSNPPSEPQPGLNDVFSLRRPKNAGAGLSSGLKSVTKGIVGGAAALVVGPIVGAHRGGVTGFAKGLASGVVGAVVLPVAGVGVGAVQMVRGVMNTPEAMVQAAHGKIWDEERREWVAKDMIVAAEPLRNKKGGGGGGAGRPAGGDDYYAILQVPHDATADQIKKQYYALARKYHPDKNAGDEAAHGKFQKLGEAYQVLGNEELRGRYDTHGTQGLDVNFMDGGAFFNMLFGSDQFEHLVGELFITMAARSGGEADGAEMAREQGVRVQQLCVNLKAILKRYTAGDEEGFVAAMREEASRLVKASFGETMLRTIGKVYDMQADIVTGGFFGGLAAKWRVQGQNMKSQYKAVSAAVKVQAAQQQIEAWEKQQERKAAAAAAAAAAPPVAPSKEAAAAAAAGETPAAAAAGAPAATAPAASATAAGGATAAEPTRAEGAPAAATGEAKAEAAGAAGASTAAPPAPGAPPPAGGAAAAGPSIEELMGRKLLEEAAMPLMLEAMWAANVLDIQRTLKKVCKFVLTEEGAPKPELQARANALKVLGGIFMEAKAPDSPAAGHTDARQQMEEAMLRVVEKRAKKEEGGAEEGEDDK